MEKDISYGNSYVVEDDDKRLAATFAFIKGEDPTYYGIENGAWLNHEPYGTIHRLAGNPSCHGIAIPFGAFLVNWMIPKIIERIASGIFTKEKNKTNAIMPSTMDAIPNPRPPEETSLTLQF